MSTDGRMRAPAEGEVQLRTLRAAPQGRARIALFTMLRDEMYFIPRLFDHYRSLGVDRFVAYDDGSTDGTREFLLAQPDTEVITSDAKYGQKLPDGTNVKLHVTNRVISRTGLADWLLVVDADEFLLLPGGIGFLADLIAQLEARGDACLLAPMVDFHPETLAARNHATSLGPFAVSRLFDGEALFQRVPGHLHPVLARAGIRFRLTELLAREHPAVYHKLYEGDRYRQAVTWKVPLIRGDLGITLKTIHTASRPAAAWVQATIAHFKFTPSLDARIAQALQSGAYYRSSLEYRLLDALIRHFDDRSLVTGRTRVFDGPASLEAAGHMFLRA